MLRFLVMFFPAVAVLGVMAPMSSIVHRVANMAGASVVNVIAFAAGAAVHTTVVSALLSRSQQGGMNLLVLVLCLVSTLVAFVLLFPLLSLTNIVGMSAGGRGAHALRRAGRLTTRYATTKKAVEKGERDAQLVGEADPVGGGSATTGSQRHRRINLPAESFGRPEPRRVPVAAGTGIGRGRVSVAALSAGPAVRLGSSRVAQPAVGNYPSVRHRALKPGGVREGTPGWLPMRETLTRNLVPIEGVVVEHPPSRMPAGTVVHDSEAIISSEGVGPRLFDPATKATMRIVRNGTVIDEGWTP